MIFFQLTQARIAERMLSLPMGLQFVLDDAETKLLVDNIAEESGINSESVSILETLVSLVFMGFLHPEKVYDELVELGVDQPLADTITKRLQAEIFADFDSLLKQVYAPVEAAPAPMPAPLPRTAAAQAPAFPSKEPAAAGAPVSAPAGARPFPPAPAKPLPPANGMPQPAPAPMPFMLRKETTAVPAAPTFKLSVDPKIFAPRPGARPSMPLPPKPAQLELGKETAPAGPKPAPGMNVPPPPSMRPIHYAGPQSSIGIPAAPQRPAAPVVPPPAPTPPKIRPIPAAPAAVASPAISPVVPGPRPQPAKPSVLPPTPAPLAGAPPRDLPLSAREDARRFVPGKDLAPHLAPKNIPAPSIPAPVAGKPVPAPAAMPAPANAPAAEPKKPPRIVNFTEGGEAG